MIRVNEIIDPVLRDRVVEVLARREGLTPDQIPHSYQMDDRQYAELLQELNEIEDVLEPDLPEDPRE